jgi:hypothetical protein
MLKLEAITGEHPSPHGSGDISPAVKDGSVARPSRLAEVTTYTEPQGPMLGTHEIGSKPRRSAATTWATSNEISVVADADSRNSAGEVKAAAGIARLIDDAATEENPPRVGISFLLSCRRLRTRDEQNKRYGKGYTLRTHRFDSMGY